MAIGEVLELGYQSSVQSPSVSAQSPSASTDNSTVEFDKKIYQTLYLLERFGVSDQFYHELLMINPTLPR